MMLTSIGTKALHLLALKTLKVLKMPYSAYKMKLKELTLFSLAGWQDVK